MNVDDLTFEQGSARALELGLPPKTAWKRIWTPEPISKDRVTWRVQGPVPPGILFAYSWTGPPSPTERQFPGYYLDTFGPVIDWPIEVNPPRPYFRIRDDESGTWFLTVLKLVARAEHAETGVWAQLSCDFETGKQEILTGGYRGRGHREDDEIAAGARRLLLLDRSMGHKQKGDGAAWTTDEEFRFALDEAVRAVQTATGRAKPDTDAVIRRLPVEKTAFYQYVKTATGKRWRDLQRNYAARYIAEKRGNRVPQNEQ
jgi:hypothetical protein